MSFEYVQWRRRNPKRGMTMTHLVVRSLNNTHGRTGCGRLFPRNVATVSWGDIASVTCRSCHKALASGEQEARSEAGPSL